MKQKRTSVVTRNFTSLNFILTGEVVNAEELALDAERKKVIASFLSKRLSEREVKVINHYFGLSGEAPKTQKEVGEALNLGAANVHVILQKSLRRLRHPAGLLLDNGKRGLNPLFELDDRDKMGWRL